MAELQDVVESLARRLGRSVAIDDPRFQLVAYSSHTGQVDRVRMEWLMTRGVSAEVARWVNAQGVQGAAAAVRVRGNPALELLDRLCVPIRYRERLLGFVWLIDDGDLDDAAVAEVTTTAEQAAEIMYRQRLLDDLQRSQERELLRDLLSERDDVRSQAAISLGESDLLSGGGRHVVIAAGALDASGHLQPTHPWMEGALGEFRLRLPRRAFIHLVRPDHGILVWAPAPTQGLEARRELVESLLREMRRAGAATPLLGVSDLRRGAVEMRAAHREAFLALRVSSVITGFRPVAVWPELGIYQLLARYPEGDIGEQTLPEGLRRLLARREHAPLVETLEVFLDAAGSTAATAARLRIHRVSLYARLRRIEEISGLEMSRGQDRLALHLGLKLARLAGLLPTGAGSDPG